MKHSDSQERVEIQAGGSLGLFILVPSDQAELIRSFLQENGVTCSLSPDALSVDGSSSESVINILSNGKDIQSMLDAAVLVHIRLVDGGMQEYYDTGELVERYTQLVQNFSGRDLIHELISDDWGAPPTTITLEATTRDGKDFVAVMRYK